MLTLQRNKRIIISMSMLMTWRRPWIGELRCMDCQTSIGLFNVPIWTLHHNGNKIVLVFWRIYCSFDFKLDHWWLASNIGAYYWSSQYWSYTNAPNYGSGHCHTHKVQQYMASLKIDWKVVICVPRFAQFFTCPLLSADATSREINAVDAGMIKVQSYS